MVELQSVLDRTLRAPAWAGFALLALAAAMVILGRHGQRPLNCVLLGGGAFALAFFGLRGLGPGWVPGVAGIIGAMLLAIFGLVAGAWGTAAVVAGVLAAAGALLARWLKIPVWGLVPLGFGLGLFTGMVNRGKLPLVLPPLFAAAFAALGAAICWAPHQRGAALWQLNDVIWVMGLAAVLAIPLLAFSLEREYRKKVRLAARTPQMEDDELKQRLAEKQQEYQRKFEAAQEPPPDTDPPPPEEKS